MYRKLALCLSPLLLFAQGQDTAPKTPIAALPAVRALVESSMERHPALAAARARAEARREAIGLAGAPHDPEAAFGVQRAPDRHVVISGDHAGSAAAIGLYGVLPGMTEYSLSLGQAIPWPGKLAAREAVARREHARGEVEVMETALALETEVLISCLELLATQAQRELVLLQLGHWAALEEMIKAKLEQGDGSAAEAIRAMQEQSRLNLRLLELGAKVQDQTDSLNRLAARDMGTSIDLGADILEMERPVPPEDRELLKDLMGRSPEWRAAAVVVSGADASLHYAKMDRYPDLHAGVSVSKASRMPPMWMAEVGVTLPVWGGRKQGRAVAMARAELDNAHKAKDGLALELEAASRELARAWRLAEDTALLYEKEIIPQGEAALELTKARFLNGEADLLSAVGAMDALLKDQEGRLEAITRVHRMAIQQYGAMPNNRPMR